MYMKIVEKYYGYPVISPQYDDYNDIFDIQVDSIEIPTEEVILVRIRIQIENKDLLKLIESGHALFTVHFEESRTCYREIVQFKDLEYEHKISFGKIREKIEVCGFITTTTSIDKFNSDSMHQFYKDNEIAYDPYQIIGISSGVVIEIVKEEDDVQEPKSIFAIIANKNENESMYKLEWSESKIIIMMPHEQFKIYTKLSNRNQFKNQSRDILLAKIVMPVMIATFNELKESIDNYEDKIWYKSIIKAFQDKKIDFENELKKESFDSYHFTQLLFESVYSKAMDQIIELLSLRGEDD